MSEIKVMSWNVKDGLSDEARAPLIVDALIDENPDVAVLSEAYNVRKLGNIAAAIEAFDGHGYVVTHVPQERSDNRPDQHGIALLTRQELTRDARPISLAGRYAVKATMVSSKSGQEYEVVGQHGNDKNEQLRLDDARALRRSIAFDENYLEIPTIVAGDLNTMPANTAVARALRLAGPFVNLLPSAEPNPEAMPTGIRRFASLGRRLSQMAIGKAFNEYLSYGLRDADFDMVPTMDSRGIRIKPDHIMVSDHFIVRSHAVHTTNVSKDIDEYIPASDHRAISARLDLEAA